MKKIISLVFVIAMLFACTAPAFAESFKYQVFNESTSISNDSVFNYLSLQNNVEVTIGDTNPNIKKECNVEIANQGTITLDADSILKICSHCSLIGENIHFYSASNSKIITTETSYINLSFHSSTEADTFEKLLTTSESNHIRYGEKQYGARKYIRSGNHIVYGCFHSEWKDGVCTNCGIHCLHETYDDSVCTVCGKACENEFHNGIHTCPDCGMVVDTTATGSVLSQGYPEIVFGIGGVAIGVVATLLFSRKKKVAVSSTSAEDEE